MGFRFVQAVDHGNDEEPITTLVDCNGAPDARGAMINAYGAQCSIQIDAAVGEDLDAKLRMYSSSETQLYVVPIELLRGILNAVRDRARQIVLSNMGNDMRYLLQLRAGRKSFHIIEGASPEPGRPLLMKYDEIRELILVSLQGELEHEYRRMLVDAITN